MLHYTNLLSDNCNLHTENISDITDNLIIAYFQNSMTEKRRVIFQYYFVEI
jgi:hypothetical protein